MLLKYREQHDLARDLAEKTLALKADDRHGSQFFLRKTWAFELAHTGDYQAALIPFQEFSPWLNKAVEILSAVGKAVIVWEVKRPVDFKQKVIKIQDIMMGFLLL